MKQIISLLLAASLGLSSLHAQNKNYLSIDGGLSFSGMSNKLSDNMKANGFGSDISGSFIFFFYFSTQYPIKSVQNLNYKIRYGYNINERTAIEAGYGLSYRTLVSGADGTDAEANYLDIKLRSTTAYAAFMLRNKKGNLAIGMGPAVAICNIQQSSSGGMLSDKNYVLPGGILTGYWHFINHKSWFMGMRSDMTITAPAKTETVTVTNPVDKNFVSVSKGSSVGAVMNSFSIAVGIKF